MAAHVLTARVLVPLAENPANSGPDSQPQAQELTTSVTSVLRDAPALLCMLPDTDSRWASPAAPKLNVAAPVTPAVFSTHWQDGEVVCADTCQAATLPSTEKLAASRVRFNKTLSSCQEVDRQTRHHKLQRGGSLNSCATKNSHTELAPLSCMHSECFSRQAVQSQKATQLPDKCTSDPLAHVSTPSSVVYALSTQRSRLSPNSSTGDKQWCTNPLADPTAERDTEQASCQQPDNSMPVVTLPLVDSGQPKVCSPAAGSAVLRATSMELALSNQVCSLASSEIQPFGLEKTAEVLGTGHTQPVSQPIRVPHFSREQMAAVCTVQASGQEQRIHVCPVDLASVEVSRALLVVCQLYANLSLMQTYVKGVGDQAINA
jgi:hypothetical protein